MLMAHEEMPKDDPPSFASTLSPLVAATGSWPSPYSKKKSASSMITTRRSRPTPSMMDDSSSPLATRTRTPNSTGGAAVLGSSSSPPSKMTPDAKRLKFQSSTTTSTSATKATQEPAFRIEYPTSTMIPVPSKSTLKALLEQALDNTKKEDTTNHSAKNNDQAHLQPAGILSLEQILLPAIALQEEAALKRVQAKIQRDAPEYKSAVEDSRRLIRSSMRKAIQAVQVSRQQRLEQQVIRRQEAAEQARQERLQKQQERARHRQLEMERQRQEAEQAREQRFTATKRQRNRGLYQEILILHRSMTKLEKEQRMWTQAQEQQDEWKQQQQQQTAQKATTGAAAAAAATASDDIDSSDNNGTAVVLRERTETTIQDMVLASTRIQQGLAGVLHILKDSEQTRQQLYKDYHRNHHFEGYQGVRNPKGLIRFLSQEQE
jgi:hypothetical protein